MRRSTGKGLSRVWSGPSTSCNPQCPLGGSFKTFPDSQYCLCGFSATVIRSRHLATRTRGRTAPPAMRGMHHRLEHPPTTPPPTAAAARRPRRPRRRRCRCGLRLPRSRPSASAASGRSTRFSAPRPPAAASYRGRLPRPPAACRGHLPRPPVAAAHPSAAAAVRCSPRRNHRRRRERGGPFLPPPSPRLRPHPPPQPLQSPRPPVQVE